VCFAIPTSYPLIREAKKQLQQAIVVMYAVQKQASLIRTEFLEQCAKFLSATGEGSSAAIVKRIQHAETKLQIFQHLRWLSAKIPPPPLSFLVKDIKSTTQSIVGADEIDQELFYRNIQHFSQADLTPFAKGELRGLFGNFGTNSFSSAVLNGETIPAILTDSDAKRIFFETLQQPTGAPEISGRITGQELQDGYKVWNERTSTSPSGLHLGHDKTLLHKTILNDERDFSSEYFDHKSRMINPALLPL
jgi:hypothetical protein